MATATLTYDLPEEEEQFSHAVHGLDWALVVLDMAEYLRTRLKREELPDDVVTALGAAQASLCDFMENRGVNTDMVS